VPRAFWKCFIVRNRRLEGCGDEHLTRHVRFVTVEVKHHRIQQRECRKPTARVAKKAFADARAALGIKKMRDWFPGWPQAGLFEHRSEPLLWKVFGYEIFLAVPGTEFAAGVLGKQAIDRDCEAAAWFENAVALIQCFLRVAKVFEAAHAHDTIEGAVVKWEFFGKSLLEGNAVSVESPRQVESCWIWFEPDSSSCVLCEIARPITVTAADVEQNVLFARRDSTEKFLEFAPSVQGTNALNCAHQASH